jgi:very-short-patch-repair endonuclease
LTPAISLKRARHLRREQTDAERRLWSILRNRRFADVKFRRQFPIDRYIVDFCRIERKLVIELDGEQHVTQVEADSIRTEFLAERGYRVLRIWDDEWLLESEATIERIWNAVTLG